MSIRITRNLWWLCIIRQVSQSTLTFACQFKNYNTVWKTLVVIILIDWFEFKKFSILLNVSFHSGKDIVTQVVPIPEQILKLPGRSSKATKELVFQAVNIAPLGYQSFYVNLKPKQQDDMQSDQPKQKYSQIGRQVTINFNRYRQLYIYFSIVLALDFKLKFC